MRTRLHWAASCSSTRACPSTAGSRARRATIRQNRLPTARRAASAALWSTATPSRSPISAQSLVRLGRRCRQPVGTEHPPDRGGKGAGPHRGTAARATGLGRGDSRQPTRHLLPFGSSRTMPPSACSSTSPRRSPRSRRRSSRGAHPSTTFRDAVARGRSRSAMARYPLAAQRGPRKFHRRRATAASATSVPTSRAASSRTSAYRYFAEKGRVDPGRHGGIAALQASPFNLLGRYNDNPRRRPAWRPGMSSSSIATGASSACPRCATSPAPRPTCTTAAWRR